MGQIIAGGYLDRYNSLVKGLLGIKGEPFTELEPSLLADLSIEQAPAAAYEWYFLMGTTRYTSGLQITAVPAGGLFAGIELRNPTGSNVLTVLETAYLIPIMAGPARYDFGVDSVALGGGVGFGLALDTREITGKKSACQLRVSAGSAVQLVTDGSAYDTQEFGATTEEDVPFPVATGLVLAPGHACSIAATAANTQAAAVFVWRERQLGASELKAT